MEVSPQKKANSRKRYRYLRIFGKIIITLLIILALLILFIRSPWGQNIIITKITSYVSSKTNTKVELKKFYLTFGGNLLIKNLYLEDTKGDTLMYSKSLEADIALWSLISGKTIGIDAIHWQGLRAKIQRKDTVESYNFQFLIDAFATKDTTQNGNSEVPTITLGEIALKNINIDYNDSVAGIESTFNLENILLDMEEIDLEKMRFKASLGRVENSKIKFHQSPVPNTPNAKETPLPILSIEELFLNKVAIDYAALKDGLTTRMYIDDFFAEIPKVNLAENAINIGNVQLSGSEIAIRTAISSNALTAVDKAEGYAKKFNWPVLQLKLDAITLHRNTISYQAGNATQKTGTFNPEALFLEDVSLMAKDLYIADQTAGVKVDTLSFREASGINLKNMGFKGILTDNQLNIQDFSLSANENMINGGLKLKYSSLSDLAETPEKSKIDLQLSYFRVDVKEVFQFQPALLQNKNFVTLSKKPISGTVMANGYLSHLNLPKVHVNWGDHTNIVLNGEVENSTEPNSLKFSINLVEASTTKNDILAFLKEEDFNSKLPDKVTVRGEASGTIDGINAAIKINTTQGTAIVEGNVKITDPLAFDARIAIKEYQLGDLLKNETLGSLSLTLEGSGSGNTIDTLNAQWQADITCLDLNEYTIKDLAIQGVLNQGEGEITSVYKDDNINAALKASIILDTIAPQVDVDLNLIGADVQGLGIVQRDIRTGLKLHANFKGNTTDYDLKSTVKDGVVVYENNTYLLGDLEVTAHVRKDTTAVAIKNKILNAALESNADPKTFSKAIQRHMLSYFYRDTEVPDVIKNPVNLKMKTIVSQDPLLKEVFLVNVSAMDTISLRVDFNEKSRMLKADISAPLINYSGNTLDSLAFTIHTDRDAFTFDFGCKELNVGPFSVKRMMLTGNQENNEMNLEFLSLDGAEKLMHIQSKITGNRERLKLHILPENLLLNKHTWNIPSTNEVVYTKNTLEFNDFRMSRNEQAIEITDKMPGRADNHVAVVYNNFNLSEIFKYLNPEKHFAEGIINGEFAVVRPFSDIGILADLTVDDLKIMSVDIGDLVMNARETKEEQYTIHLETTGGDVSLKLLGDYWADTSRSNMDFNVQIPRFKLSALEGFSGGEVRNTDGFFTGNFTIRGPLNKPKYNGTINFNNAKFEIAKLNASFMLRDETLSINNQGLLMNDFIIEDGNTNTLAITGKVGTKNIVNPTFDLSIRASDFQALNATEEDNDFLYGTVVLDANAKLTGDLQIPKLDIEATVNSETDITYVMPSATVNVEDRDGIVVFVNRENPEAILTRSEAQTATLTGFDISAFVNIDDGAKVNLVINEETGDHLQVSGAGDFNFTMAPNGRMNLVGRYDLSNGHYEMNLYNLVNRKFELVKGSRVSWSGDPFDAKLDIKALYNVETSASPLMAAQTSEADPSVKSKFRQVLPFNVYLNVDGELLQPKISFAIDMPEEEQGAIGGQVYGRIQQLNQQEVELNKQVFSLLVLNRFYPELGSDGSRGGAEAIVRDNINDALSDQLNVLSDKVLGDTGLELDFGLDSYTDYQGETPTDRVQLDVAAQKKLLDDRLIVRVGSEVDLQGSNPSGEPAPLIGNVSVEYILTENGRYRLRGFRRNQFENVIDGQTIASGIALIFTQEFNTFRELWDAIFLKDKAEEANNSKRKKKKQMPDARGKKTDDN